MEIEVVETQLPDETYGNCGYLNNTASVIELSTNSPVIIGKDYTLSLYAKLVDSDETKDVKLVSGTYEIVDKQIVESIWKRLKFTFRANGEIITIAIPKGKYYLYEAKLEEGNIATMWSPSLQDSEDEYLELATRIDITEKGLLTKVSKGEVVSEINQQPESVKIDAKNINLNGIVTANDNFKILEDGRLVAENGEFSGTIKSNNAVITGGSLKIETSSKEEDVMSLSWTSSDGYEWNSTVRTTGISATMKDPTTGFYQNGALTCGGLNGYQQISNIDDLYYSVGYDGFRYWKETNNGTNIPNRDYYYIADSEGILAKSVRTTSGADLDSLNSKFENLGNYEYLTSLSAQTTSTLTLNNKKFSDYKFITAILFSSTYNAVYDVVTISVPFFAVTSNWNGIYLGFNAGEPFYSRFKYISDTQVSISNFSSMAVFLYGIK